MTFVFFHHSKHLINRLSCQQVICSLVRESAKRFSSQNGHDSAMSGLKNLGNSLYELMTASQYYTAVPSTVSIDSKYLTFKNVFGTTE